MIARTYVAFTPSFVVITSTFHTFPSAFGKVLFMRAMGLFYIASSLDQSSTRSPFPTYLVSVSHLHCGCSRGRNSFCHLDQKIFARCCTCLHCLFPLQRSVWQNFPGAALREDGFCVNIIDGVRTLGIVGSFETGTRGRLLTIAITSAIHVLRTLWVRRVGPTSIRMESKTL